MTKAMNFGELLIEAIRYNILGDIQLRNRMVGFRGEIEFGLILDRLRLKKLQGGMFVPTVAGNRALIESVYFTILPPNENLYDYVEVYKNVERIGLKNMYLIRYQPVEHWATPDTGELPDPGFEFHLFNGHEFEESSAEHFFSNYILRSTPYDYKNISDQKLDELQAFISGYSKETLSHLYVERYFFDFTLARRFDIGIPADIDFIYYTRKNHLRLGEVKEKDLAKRVAGFGLDLHRIEGMLTIMQRTGIKYFLFVREVADQKARVFKKWWYVMVPKFWDSCDKTKVEGGTGMRSKNSHNPTYLCLLNAFEELTLNRFKSNDELYAVVQTPLIPSSDKTKFIQ